VYLLPLPREAERLAFTIDRITLRRADGGEVSLEVVERAVDGADANRQRRLAWGRVPPGTYAGLSFKAGSATLLRDGERSRLVVADEPAHADVHFTVNGGAEVVLWANLKPAESVRRDYEFSPAFSTTIAPQTPPPAALYCTDAGAATVTVLDRHARLVTGSIAVGAAPRGMAIDRTGARAYVALGAEDQIQIVDPAANATIDRIRLSPGDGPRELALTPDGATLVSLNERSRTVSFVDVLRLTELGRVSVGDGPVALLLDRPGRRAYVVNRASSSISVIDVGTRLVIATLATDAEPLRAQLSRDGTRLYVVHRGSQSLVVFSVPSFALLTRAFVPLGVTTLKIDPRTDLLYLSRGDERRISVYDPLALQPLDAFDVPGAATYMTIDDAENTLLAVLPERRTLAVFDLTSRKLLAELPVGLDSYLVALIGERL
jgi:YVTN family beta-propeller protein